VFPKLPGIEENISVRISVLLCSAYVTGNGAVSIDKGIVLVTRGEKKYV
jgi:hypothetical protein